MLGAMDGCAHSEGLGAGCSEVLSAPELAEPPALVKREPRWTLENPRARRPSMLLQARPPRLRGPWDKSV